MGEYGRLEDLGGDERKKIIIRVYFVLKNIYF